MHARVSTLTLTNIYRSAYGDGGGKFCGRFTFLLLLLLFFFNVNIILKSTTK